MSEKVDAGSMQTQSLGTDDSRPVKRSRVSRACDQCRVSRDKCDGAQPTCVTCRSQNLDCSYSGPAKKRGIQSNYLRTLELTLSWVFQTFPAVESELAKNLSRRWSLEHRIINGIDSAASEALYQRWRNGIINKQIEQILSGASIDQPSSTTAPPPMSQREQTSAGGLPYQSPVMLESLNNNPSPNRPGKPKHGENIDYEQRVSLPAKACILLEYYFAFTHSWIPMIEKHGIFKLMYSYPSEGILLSTMQNTTNAEFWGIMALAAAQMTGEIEFSEANRIRKIAESMIPGQDSFELPHVVLMLLLAMIDVQQEQTLVAWFRMGTAVRALSVLKSAAWMPANQSWKQVHLAAFILESALASYLNAPSHFNREWAETIGLIDEDGMDEWVPWSDPLDSAANSSEKVPARSLSTFNQLVSMIIQFSLKVDTFLPPRTSGSPDSDLVFSLLRNATLPVNRLPPSTIVNQTAFGMGATQDLGSLPAQDGNAKPMQWHMPSTVGGFRQNQVLNVQDDIFSDGITPGPSTGGNLQDLLADPAGMHQDAISGSAFGTDIFEELALLGREYPEQHLQFMQNLGFAPGVEFDLAEFLNPD